MALRKLQGERTEEMISKCVAFAKKANGKPYGFSFSKLYTKKTKAAAAGGGGGNGSGNHVNNGKSDGSSITANGNGVYGEEEEEEEEEEDEGAGFFCSELVAAGLQEMGIIDASCNSSYFWPGSFGKGGEIDESLCEGLSYGDVILLDCKTMEVGESRISSKERSSFTFDP